MRRGEQAAIARINHLKGANAVHERQIAVLTASLAAQHELLADVNQRVAALARAVPASPRELKQQAGAQPELLESLARAVHQLQVRLQKGALPASARSGVGSGAARSAEAPADIS